MELQEIADKFILPLVKAIRDPMGDRTRHFEGSFTAHDAPNSGYKDCLDLIFGVKYRDIIIATAIKGFKMPGKIHTEAGIVGSKQGTVLEHYIKMRSSMLVRIDERSPNRIDIEVMTGIDSSISFSLSNTEYRSIYHNLKEKYPCQNLNKLLPPGYSD